MTPPTQVSAPREYLLGTGRDELERLAVQHRLWSDAATVAWRLARIGAGQRVLDVGCGPGYAAFDLAQIVTGWGSVTGVDESPAFIEHLEAQAIARGLPQLRGVVGDVQQLEAVVGSARSFDLAWSRWVLCFVPAPEAVVRGVAALLRPGGRFVIHDYFNYGSMTTAPRRASHDRVVEATIRSWRGRGGDPDVGARLPRMLVDAGFEVTHMTVHQRVARAGETMLQWPVQWWRTYAPKLVAMGQLSQADCDELLRDLDEISGDPAQFISCPPVYEFVAIRR